MDEKIGSWWLASQMALPGERVVWSIAANRRQNAERAVGGKLFLTNSRLLFCPHWLDYVLLGRKWAVEISQIQTVDRQPSGGDFFGGGLGDRLRITQKDGQVELFVVNFVGQTIERLRSVIG